MGKSCYRFVCLEREQLSPHSWLYIPLHWDCLPVKGNFSWSHPATQNHTCTPLHTTRGCLWQWNTVCFLGFFQVCQGIIWLRPYHQQSQISLSTGKVERAVQTIKALLKKADDPLLALLAYRSTPLKNGYSPAELPMCRWLHTTVPVVPEQLQLRMPDYSLLARREREREMRIQQKHTFDQCHKTRRLDPLAPRRSRLDSPETDWGNNAHRGSTKVIRIPSDNCKWGSQKKSPPIQTSPLFSQLFVWGGYYTSAGWSCSRDTAPTSWWLVPNKKRKSLRTTRSVRTNNVKDTLFDLLKREM